MSLLTGDDFEDEEIDHEKIKQAFQQGKLSSRITDSHKLYFRNESWNFKTAEETSRQS